MFVQLPQQALIAFTSGKITFGSFLHILLPNAACYKNKKQKTAAHPCSSAKGSKEEKTESKKALSELASFLPPVRELGQDTASISFWTNMGVTALSHPDIVRTNVKGICKPNYYLHYSWLYLLYQNNIVSESCPPLIHILTHAFLL